MTSHHLCLTFDAEGGVHFFPDTADPAELAARLGRVVRLLVENPSRIACASGAGAPDPVRGCPT